MHMADALLSPAVGAAMWLASGAALALSARRVRSASNENLAPLMGVLGAFVFAAQMINVAIPGTGSSGHLGGGLLLAILLGPHAALIVIASVLTVQALFFADGGLLALGANIFNVGVLPCLVAYPLVWRPLAGRAPGLRRGAIATVIAAVVGLQLGAMGVVLQTAASGISSLPLDTFLWLMLPIQLAIGAVEGVATVAIVRFIQRTQPELLMRPSHPSFGSPRARRPVLVGALVAALITGGVLSWFASEKPDGLEWAIMHAARAPLMSPQDGVHRTLAEVQARAALLPDYNFAPARADAADAADAATERAGTSLAGVVGGAITLALIGLIAMALKRRR